jgi:hypothetical protein
LNEESDLNDREWWRLWKSELGPSTKLQKAICVARAFQKKLKMQKSMCPFFPF